MASVVIVDERVRADGVRWGWCYGITVEWIGSAHEHAQVDGRTWRTRGTDVGGGRGFRGKAASVIVDKWVWGDGVEVNEVRGGVKYGGRAVATIMREMPMENH